MFKGISNRHNFNGFSNQIFGNQTQGEAFGFGSCKLWMNPDKLISAQSDLERITYWVDSINGIYFQQTNIINQPRLLKSVIDFGGNDIIENDTGARGLFCQQPLTINSNYNTLAFVYQPITLGTGGSIQNRLIGDNDFSFIRNNGFGFSHGVVNNSTPNNQVGFNGPGAGFSYGTNDTTVFSTNPRILIFTRDVIIMNGISYPISNQGNPNSGFLMSYIMGNATLAMRIGDILVYNKRFTESQCIELSNNINTKYTIY
jgi:hypothetical protein